MPLPEARPLANRLLARLQPTRGGGRGSHPGAPTRSLDALDEAIAAIDKELAASVKADETAKRLMTIPGVGPDGSGVKGKVAERRREGCPLAFACEAPLRRPMRWPRSTSPSRSHGACSRHPAMRRLNALLGERIHGATVAEIAGAAHFMIATHAKEVAGLIASHVAQAEAACEA